MTTKCNSVCVPLEGLGRRAVVGKFDGGRMSSDAGAVLLRSANTVFNVIGRLAGCFSDHREAGRVEHPVEALIGQRVYGLALGYEDLNDHDRLRDDSVLALALEREDVTGEARVRARDRGHPLAGSSTLNRVELGTPETAAKDRYKKIVADPEAIDALMVDLFLDAHQAAPEELVLDLDATDDPLHGQQEGRFFHGYYGGYCYLPLYITCGEHVVCCRLRPSDIDASAGSVQELSRIVERIRGRWPQTRIVIRGDSGFCREEIMAWCEANDLDFVFGLARNARLQRAIARQMRRSRSRCVASGAPSRRFRDFRYRTRNSWSRSRRVVGKAEWLPGARGANPRFVVTSLGQDRSGTRTVYEELYCTRGDMENRIKEQQLDLFADRTSTATMRANQLRLYFSAFAGIVLQIIRQFGLAGTDLAAAQCGTIRVKLLKIAGVVKVTARKVWVSFSSVYPCPERFARIVARLQALARASPG